MVLDFSMENELFPESKRADQGFGADTVNWTDVGTGIVPIGGVVAWCKTLVAGTTASALIPNYLECDGSLISDGDSPLDGVTLPNLNNPNKFLRGSTTSGTAGGSDSAVINLRNADAASDGSGGGYKINSYNSNNMPVYYEVVWVMRIK